jgi:peptidyl-prolyl cis-trans isomerase C
MSGGKWTWQGLAGAAMLVTLAGRAPAQAPAPAAQPGAERLAAPKATDGTTPVALVNGEVITLGELEAVLKLSGPTPVQLPEEQQRHHRMEALGMLIDEVLMRQFLTKNAPPVPEAEVGKRVAELEAGLKRQGKSLQELCREINKTEAQVRADIAHGIQWANYSRARVTEADARKYYDEYRDFFDKVTVRASHIVLRVPAGTPEAERAQARAKLTELRAQLVAGKLDFAEAAKAHSQDPSAQKGGDLGWFPRLWVFDDAFARPAFALQVGQISDVVQTDYGLHLIKVTDRKPGQPSEYDKIKDAVREFCTEDLHQQILAQQRKTSDIKINLP